MFKFKPFFIQTLFWLCLSAMGIAMLAKNAYSQNRAGNITGKVIDRDTKQAVIGASVQVLGTLSGANTDTLGNFQITDLANGLYSLRINSSEYKSMVRTDVIVTASQTTKLIIELAVDSYRAKEIVVTGESYFSKSVDTPISTNTLTQEEIRRAPGASEDVT